MLTTKKVLEDAIKVREDELFYLKECSYQEVSRITGYDMKEVKSYIQNGKRNLKNYITRRDEQTKNE